MGRKTDLSGEKYGRLTVLYKSGVKTYNNGQKKSLWMCRCDCGNIVEVPGYLLTRNHTQSCGCLRRDRVIERETTHGMSKSRLYRIWCGMKARCCNNNFWEYYNYGGRGISVCKEWIDDFFQFKEWALNNGYDESLSIDRINPDGDYSPSNCRWIDKCDQSKNRRTSINISFNGETLQPMEWSKRTGIPYSTIVYRYHLGLTPEEILDKNNRKTVMKDRRSFIQTVD